ncbi:MAG: hypothetical protein ACX932_07385 [Gammaproteobacteria bacterium]
MSSAAQAYHEEQLRWLYGQLYGLSSDRASLPECGQLLRRAAYKGELGDVGLFIERGWAKVNDCCGKGKTALHVLISSINSYWFIYRDPSGIML